MKKQYISWVAALLFPLMASAQMPLAGFDSEDYASIGTFDPWIASPFNTGKLTGNVKIIANPEKDAVNSTKQVLAFQRSRFASNRFGAKVMFKTPFTMEAQPNSPVIKYVHVYINKPVAGRCLLICLGKRPERPAQAIDTWEYSILSTNTVGTDKWVDAIFPVKGANGTEIHGVVVVPDCEQTYTLNEDFMCYIDSIEVNSSARARSTSVISDYSLNFDASLAVTRADRLTNSVTLTGETSGATTITLNNTAPKPVYRDLTTNIVNVKAGEVCTPAVSYVGSWMMSYFYADLNNDGQFKVATGSEGNELLSYSCLNGKNSAGVTAENGGQWGLTMPSFTIPTTQKAGFYRVRTKVDWDNTDPAGNFGNGNDINNNGGQIVDFIINVHPDTVSVAGQFRNGEIVNGDGTPLTSSAPFGMPLTVKMKGAEKFQPDYLVVRHGYNLSGNQFAHNIQWREDTISAKSADANGNIVIPASLINGNVMLIGQFATVVGITSAKETSALKVSSMKGALKLTSAKAQEFSIANAEGKILQSGVLTGSRTISLPVGTYIVNQGKYCVQ